MFISTTSKQHVTTKGLIFKKFFFSQSILNTFFLKFFAAADATVTINFLLKSFDANSSVKKKREELHFLVASFASLASAAVVKLLL